jgi:hypothetical protein
MRRRRFSLGSLAAVLTFAVGIAGCGDPEPVVGDSTALKRARWARLIERKPGDGPGTFAVLINGGMDQRRNYQSHLLHVQELMRFLARRGVPLWRIFVFNSDGKLPGADMAVRDLQPEGDFWLIERTALGQNLRSPIRYENSVLQDKKVVFPARRRALERWATQQAQKYLRAGDTLLVYVTDHGSKNPDDPQDNVINLWGEDLSVTQFRQWLVTLPEGLRVVLLMSQCYSGSFAKAMYPLDGPELPSGEVCGYFSSTAGRRAHGCYPEDRGKENVGHSFRFFEGLRVFGSLPRVHHRVLLTDRTPDIPTRTSDFFLRDLLGRAAMRQGVGVDRFVDDLLGRVGKDAPAYPRMFAHMDRIGRSFGLVPPRSLALLANTQRDLRELKVAFQHHARRWRAALGDLSWENLNVFLEAFPDYRGYRDSKVTKALDSGQKREARAALLQDLVGFTREDPSRLERLERLHQMATDAGDAMQRMRVRRAVALRIRTQLTRIAGLIYLSEEARSSEREAFKGLMACENLRFARRPPKGGRPGRAAAAGPPTDAKKRKGRLARLLKRLPLPPPFPPLEEDRALLERVVPGWMGISFEPLPEWPFEGPSLPRGAVRVERVLPDSPAARSDIRVGDIILGPADDYFTERRQIREWAMTSVVGEERTLEALRDGELVEINLTIGAAPVPLGTPP